MAIDENTVKRVANLARISIEDTDVAPLARELSGVLGMIDQLAEVDVEGVEPMTSVTPMNSPLRKDVINDGEKQDDVLSNAPLSREGFFAVPKVVE